MAEVPTTHYPLLFIVRRRRVRILLGHPARHDRHHAPTLGKITSWPLNPNFVER